MVSKQCFYIVLFIKVYMQSVNVGWGGGGIHKKPVSPLSPNIDENEISLYIITDHLFKHSSDENKGSDHPG